MMPAPTCTLTCSIFFASLAVSLPAFLVFSISSLV
jgi:hypothetical protein